MRRVAGVRQAGAARAGRRKRAAEAARAAAMPASATRKARSGERREAILAAALDEFSSRGFEAARLEDVARRAGVAKGTIYLYFRDKESLFQELIRTMLTPLVGTIEAMGQADVPLPAAGRPHRRPVCQPGLRNAAERRRAPHDFGRAPFSKPCRILLSRSSFPHHRSRADAAARARPHAAKCRKASRNFRRSLPRRVSSPSSGTACSNVSSRSTFAR